jgi:hypothetical protein
MGIWNTAWLLALGGVMIGCYHLLPRSRPGRLLTACLYATIGFWGTQAVLSCVIATLGLVPRGSLHGPIDYLTRYDDDRPVVLLIGSSFTQHGIDADLLTKTLSAAGREVVVLPLAVGGLSHLERLHYLKEYLAYARRRPSFVLFEIAGGYDNGPLFQLEQTLFSDRMIAMMDGASAWWAFRWLFGRNGTGLIRRTVLGGEVLAHLGLHISHIGFLRNSERANKPDNYNPSVLPPKEQHFTDEEVARLVDRAAATLDLRADWPQTVPTPWMRAFLEEEMSLLRGYDAKRIAFYSVPSMQGFDVAYARRFCEAMSSFTCIVGEDPELLAGLRRDADWYDFDHLHDGGRQLYTRWLGNRLLALDASP